MKKLLTLILLLGVGLMYTSCSDDDPEPAHADGHLKVTVTAHDETNDTHPPIPNAAVSLYFNKSNADGTADYSGTSDATGFVEFEELKAGIYFITGSALDEDNNEITGNALAEISEANHEVDVDLELE